MNAPRPALDVVVTGGTGYVGRPLGEMLAARGHRVRMLVRAASLSRVPAGVAPIEGNALDASDVAAALVPGCTLVHLVGTPHPNPSKAAEFEAVDYASIAASIAAATRVGVAQLVYMSVAQPAPVMQAYVAVRARGEASIAAAGLTATIFRPWYVIGPGHRWPMLLMPFAAIAERIPATRETARRLGFVTLGQMLRAIVKAVEHPPAVGDRRIVDVAAIRQS